MTKSNRVTNVQVPGAAPAAQPEQNTVAAAGAGAVTTPTSVNPEIVPAGAAPAGQGAAVDLQPAFDMEAMRAQIRDEERANLHAELGAQIQAASSVVNAMPAGAKPSKRDYRNMRAADIDPATLTAPVMTLDGYLCPPSPEAKK